jgi:hypothetical protein
MAGIIPIQRNCDLIDRIFPCLVGQISGITSPSPRHHEGRSRDRHATWHGLRWTPRRQVLAPDETFAAYGEVVWSWRRDPGVYPARLCGPGNGDNKGRSLGRARISRNTIARGKPGCLGCTCQIRVHSFSTSAHGEAGAVGARLSLRPLISEGAKNLQNPGENPPRDCERVHFA